MSKNKVKFGLEKVHIAVKGINQAKSIEVTEVPDTDGEVELTVTADTLLEPDSPASVVVPLATETHDTVAKVASAMVDALNNDDIIGETFRAYHDGATIYLETRVVQDNDSTFDISFNDTGTTNATMGTAQDIAEGTTGYGTPKHIEGAVNLSTDPEGDQTEFYADNMKYYVDETNNGYTGDLEVADLPDEIKTEILGMILDNNDVLVESALDKKKEFALMFEVKGDEKNRRMVYYRCKASRPGQENSTNESSVTPATDTMPVEMLPTDDENKFVKGQIELSDSNQAVYDAWFDSVTMPDVA